MQLRVMLASAAAASNRDTVVKPVICVGHAALDYVYRIDAFPPQPTKVRSLEHIESGGGMAANAAATIARLGGLVELWSRTGADAAGERIRAFLQADGVDVQLRQGARGRALVHLRRHRRQEGRPPYHRRARSRHVDGRRAGCRSGASARQPPS